MPPTSRLPKCAAAADMAADPHLPGRAAGMVVMEVMATMAVRRTASTAARPAPCCSRCGSAAGQLLRPQRRVELPAGSGVLPQRLDGRGQALLSDGLSNGPGQRGIPPGFGVHGAGNPVGISSQRDALRHRSVRRKSLLDAVLPVLTVQRRRICTLLLKGKERGKHYD